MKKVIITVITVILISAGLKSMLFADAAAGVPASNNILVVYSNCNSWGTYPVDIYNAFNTALSGISPAPAIDVVSVPCGSGPGFYNELAAAHGAKIVDATNPLKYWCQVWDIRFNDHYTNWANAGAYSVYPTGCTTLEDFINNTGGNNDAWMFTQYVNNGGMMYIQTDHSEYTCRNESVRAFINSVANGASQLSGAVGMFAAGSNTANFAAAPENFGTDFNNLAASGNLQTWYPGYLTGGYGTAVPLVRDTSGNWIFMLAWLDTNLTAGKGRIIVSYDSNAFADAAVKNATSNALIQNCYDFLSNSSCVIVTNTPTNTPTITNTFTPTQTRTATHTYTATNTFTATYTYTQTNTPTITPTSTPAFEFEHKTSYPNPFKDSTNILYYVNRDSKVTAKVFTVSGEKIATLTQDALAGYNRLFWNGTNDSNNKASSGVYVYSIQAVSGSDKSKLVWSKLTILR